MTDASGSHHWAYNVRGQVSRESQTVSGGSTYVSSYTYRADGQLKTETYPTGEVLTYGYDPARRQTSMTSNIGGTYLGNTTYDALSQPLTKALGNGTTETYTYETASARLQSLRVTQPNSAQALKREYTYHAGGNVRSIKNTTHTGAVESIAYGYDQLDRLTLACAWNVSTNSCVSGQFNQSFRYDKLGNILTKAGTNYTYGSSKPHAVTAAGANSYTYDTNGNMLTGAGRTFTWNGENQPVQIAKTGTPTETYVYDGDNVRIKRTVASSPAVTSIYVGKVEYRGTQVISTYGGVASRTTTGTPTSSNLGTIVYMHSDHLGSVSMTTSATGTVAQTQEFDPWGAVKAGGITSVSYNYTGQRLDGTGLLFYNARYYDPQLARFTSADSIVPGTSHRALTVDYHEKEFTESLKGENTQSFWFQMNRQQRQQATPPWGPNYSQNLNRYSYVLNNPLMYTDPSGHTVYMDQATATSLANEIDNFAYELDYYLSLVESSFTLSSFLTFLINRTNSGKFVIGLVISFIKSLSAYVLTALIAGGVGAVAFYLAVQDYAWRLHKLARDINQLNGKSGIAIAMGEVGFFGDDHLFILSRDSGKIRSWDVPWWQDTPFIYNFGFVVGGPIKPNTHMFCIDKNPAAGHKFNCSVKV